MASIVIGFIFFDSIMLCFGIGFFSFGSLASIYILSTRKKTTDSPFKKQSWMFYMSAILGLALILGHIDQQKKDAHRQENLSYTTCTIKSIKGDYVTAGFLVNNIEIKVKERTSTYLLYPGEMFEIEYDKTNPENFKIIFEKRILPPDSLLDETCSKTSSVGWNIKNRVVHYSYVINDKEYERQESFNTEYALAKFDKETSFRVKYLKARPEVGFIIPNECSN